MTIINNIDDARSRGDHNTILGPYAGNTTYDKNSCTDNTLFGYLAGRAFVFSCSENSIFGAAAGISMTEGGGACLFGFEAGKALTISNGTIAIGTSSLVNALTGDLLIGIGYQAGGNYTGSETSNICLANYGVTGESNVMRLGTTGSGPNQVNSTYIAGITTQVTTDPTLYDFVMIDPSTDQLHAITQANTGSIITVYSTPGNYTWTKNARTKYVQIYGWTGGCGGGSGRKGLNTIAGGGTGGAQGTAFYMECPASFLAATESVTVGPGGNGGASQTSDNTNGNIGSPGGITYFGNFRPAINVTGGDAGFNGSGTGLYSWFYADQSLYATTGPAGSGTIGNGSAATNVGPFSYVGMVGGGGGGGAGTGSFVGGGGGNILNMAGNGTFLAGGVGGTNSPGSPGNNAPTGITAAGGIMCGGSGGGGGGTDSSHGYAGGLGGFPGGGGGGGGGGLNGTFNSGAGGGGGDGLLIVIEMI